MVLERTAVLLNGWSGLFGHNNWSHG